MNSLYDNKYYETYLYIANNNDNKKQTYLKKTNSVYKNRLKIK